MSEEQSKPSGSPSRMKSRVWTMVMTAVVVGVAFALVMIVLLSPAMSPLASVHDADDDGYADSVDEFPDDESEWMDLDGDGVGDNADEFADDADETTDSDSDGVGDNSDPFPHDPDEWSDADEDGVGDNSDVFPDDAAESSDSDSDGVGDNSDAFPDDPSEWSDADGDGWGDNIDSYPEDPDKDSPEVLVDHEIMSDGVQLMFASVAPEFSWDHLTITLTDGQDVAVWETESEDLDDWEPVATHIYETFDIGGISVSLIVGDISGDGLVSAFDMLEIYPSGGAFESGVWYDLTASYEPTETDLTDFSFSFDLETPTTTLSKTAIADGFKITFGAFSEDTAWGSLSFLLSDGTNSGVWSNLTADMLDDGVGDTQVMQTVTLGTLVVSFEIVDIVGNGEANQGDYINLTAVSFSAVVDYEFTVIFEPTDGAIAQTTFSG